MLQRPRWRTIRRSRLFNRINASVSGLSVSRVANAVSQPKTRAPPNSVPAGFMTGTTSRESAESVGNEDITWNVVNRRLSTTEGFRFEWAVSPAERAASYPALAPDIRNNDHDVTANVSPQSDGPAQQTTANYTYTTSTTTTTTTADHHTQGQNSIVRPQSLCGHDPWLWPFYLGVLILQLICFMLLI